MPNRILKESICESKGLSDVSFFAGDLFKRLITYADDYGRFNADFQILLARLYPREIQIVTVDDIEDALTELVGAGKICFYTSSARNEIYGCFPKWNDHQRIRDSKAKTPEPDDTTVNDYYLRRHIPVSLKESVIERDGYKCQECGKYICSGSMNAKRLIKMGSGLFHIDHIVPVVQGGRATLENLRLLCPKCNLTRRKHFTFDEIVAFSGELPQSAASCGELPQSAAIIQSNPIQSNPNPNTESARSRFTPPTIEEVTAYCSERGTGVDAQKWFDHYSANGWMVGKNKMKDWRAAVRTWERSEFADKPMNKQKGRDHTITPAKASRSSIDALDALIERVSG